MISAVTLRALADATACLPGLTVGELRRVVAFVGALRQERIGGSPVVRDAVDATVPCLEALSTVIDHLNDLDAALGAADWIARLDPSEAPATSAAQRTYLAGVTERLAGVLDALIGVDGVELRAVTLLLRAQRDHDPST